MDRIIFHCDCNAFYASVEELFHPELKKVPMAVCGNPESRHGIILAKNELAKQYKVQTAETIWQARQKCPDLVLAPARHNQYRKYSAIVNAIYDQYTDRVERFGIDESYLDVTGSLHLFGGDAPFLAHTIRKRVEQEVGLTISVGVSFNKIFAKIGSDYKKPNAVTRIDRENYQQIIWPLPVSDLLFVGKATKEHLARLGIYTIGDLAKCDKEVLRYKLGKMGDQLHIYANGLDESPVLTAAESPDIQSVGNGMTFKRNLTSHEDIHTGVAALADSVAGRLRKTGVKCMTVQVTIKDTNLKVITRQRALSHPSYLAKELCQTAMEIIAASWKIGVPIRMLTVTASNLIPAEAAGEQLSLFEEASSTGGREKQDRLEKAMDRIRDKFGGESIALGSVLHNDLGIHEHYGDADKEDG